MSSEAFRRRFWLVFWRCRAIGAPAVPYCGRCSTWLDARCGRCIACGSMGEVVRGRFEDGLPRLRDYETKRRPWWPTGFPGVDVVLGGGRGFPGHGRVMICGDPGIGKSRFCTQLVHHLGKTLRVLYTHPEESTDAVRERCDETGLDLEHCDIVGLEEGDVEHILTAARRHRSQLVVVDSLQSLHDARALDRHGPKGLDFATAARRLSLWCQQTKSALILICHLTKEGLPAGPHTIEYLAIDVRMDFLGKPSDATRTIRGEKNRFSSAGRIAYLEFDARGRLVYVTGRSASAQKAARDT